MYFGLIQGGVASVYFTSSKGGVALGAVCLSEVGMGFLVLRTNTHIFVQYSGTLYHIQTFKMNVQNETVG